MKAGAKGIKFQSAVAILCAIIVVPGDTLIYAQQQSSSTSQHVTTPNHALIDASPHNNRFSILQSSPSLNYIDNTIPMTTLNVRGINNQQKLNDLIEELSHHVTLPKTFDYQII